MIEIPAAYRDLLRAPVIVSLGTLMPDGQPQVTPMWCDCDGTHIYINTARGRQKHANMRDRPRVTIMALDPANPYRYIEVRGVVTAITEEGADAHRNKLTREYRGTGAAPLPPGEVRVICVIEPRRVLAHG